MVLLLLEKQFKKKYIFKLLTPNFLTEKFLKLLVSTMLHRDIEN